ncbi:MAG: S1C family serine protease [Oscillospiraceae bacterium]|nr:S1C family serine protease [Oscillospiraceae bacterium]
MYSNYNNENKEYPDAEYAPLPTSPEREDVCEQEDLSRSAQATPSISAYAPPYSVHPAAVPSSTHPAATLGSAVIDPLGERRGAQPASNGIPQQQRVFAFKGYYQQDDSKPYAQRGEDWREPIYSQPPRETEANMYTPGICAAQPNSNRRQEPVRQEREPRKSTGAVGRVLRAACLIIVCVALSGAAAYGVVEGWFGLPTSQESKSEDESPVVNQVVLGGTNQNSQRSDLMPSSVVSSGVNMSAEDIYDMACSQVVGIRTEMAGMSSMGGFFNAPQGSSLVSGSGFVISSDGYILTNYHVVETAYLNDLPIIVSLHDGLEFNAAVIGYESSNDVALIKIEASGLNAAVIANSDNIRVGQTVYAVGNPFGDLVYTMTEGIVSALDRIVSVEGKNIDTFQFSAAVNSGNSGGPVFDASGEVIGIVSAKIKGDSVEGIGFAIPISDAIDIASELIEHGYITGRPLIGINVQSVTAAQAAYFDWVVGAYVLTVTPGSPAEKSGIKVGDIITKLGDAEVDSRESLIFTLRKYKAGDTATLSIWRAGEKIAITITFDENLEAGQPQRVEPQPNQRPGD